jgi:hypothetical protein
LPKPAGKRTYFLFSYASLPIIYLHFRAGIIYNIDMENSIARIGNFFILIGCILLALFAGSVIGKGFNTLYLLLGAVALFLGISLRRRAAPPPTNTRFGIFRKIQEGGHRRREEKRQKESNKKQ